VHVSCDLSGMSRLGLNAVGLRDVSTDKVTGIKLVSTTEIKAWRESKSSKTTKDSVGGGETTVVTYTYETDWTTSPASTSSFFKGGEECQKQNNGNHCENSVIQGVDLGTKTLEQAAIKLGDYDLPEAMADVLGTPLPVKPVCTTTSCGAWRVAGEYLIQGGGSVPELRKQYRISTASKGSVLAQQDGTTFEKWISTYDEDYGIFDIVEDTQTASEMFDSAAEANAAVTWILRVITLIVTICGLQMITAPITVMPDIIPCIGPMISDLIGCALCAFNTLLGCCCWMFIAGIIWLLYRPIIGGPLLVHTDILRVKPQLCSKPAMTESYQTDL
jgi:hypothetical protein